MAKIKAVIFDLDDTLFDCTGQLVNEARKRAAKAIAQMVPGKSEEQILTLVTALYRRFGPAFDVFDKICEELCVDDKDACIAAAMKAYNSDEVGDIKLFNDAVPLLKKLKAKGIKLVLLSSGIHSRQQKKIEKLGLKKWMDLILIQDVEKTTVSKEAFFKDILRRLSLRANNVVSVGDRIQREIKISNRLGMTSVRMLHGRFKELKPKNDLEEPDFEIKRLAELGKIIEAIEAGKNHKPKIVAIGGGTGLPMVLSGLKRYTKNLTAIVTVTDSGRSSGMLRREMNILPPGDIRNCLIALSDSEKLLLDLFNYRFEKGNLGGHSFGNLFIAALAKTTGSFERAVKEAGRILAIKGKALPSTLQNTHVCAELEDGTIVEEEFNVRKPGKSRIKKVFLKPAVKPSKEALKAIREADLVVLGPGSLFTSVIPNLLVKGIAAAMRKSKAKKAYVANIMTQPGQTDSFTLSMHVAEIERYLGKNALDIVLYNTKKPAEKLLKKYVMENAFIVKNDTANIRSGIKPVGRDLIERGTKQALWQKQYLLRHDSRKLARALIELLKN